MMENNSNNVESNSFLGQGWSFPISFDMEKGSTKMVGSVEDIEQSLRIILETLPGERVTNLKFGCRAKERLFDPIDSKFPFLTREAIQFSVDSYEPRILLEDVRVNRDREKEGIVQLEIQYVVKMTNARHNMVYPYTELESIF
ncbi:MAG: GPW/gp25 family protein [Bacteroidota bacterium]